MILGREIYEPKPQNLKPCPSSRDDIPSTIHRPPLLTGGRFRSVGDLADQGKELSDARGLPSEGRFGSVRDLADREK
jgi:hypothetical protein